jgi:hypothetical protein
MFAQSMGGAAMLSALGNAAEARPKIGLYRLEHCYFADAVQAHRFDEFLQAQLPLLRKHTGALGVFSVLVGPQVPATVVLSGFEGFGQMEAADGALGKIGSAPYQRADRVLLRPADFSPAVAPPPGKPGQARIFELRTDYAPAGRQIERLRDRCAGICPMLYADVVVGPNMPAFTYLIPFAGLAERQKAWDAFAAELRAGGQPMRQSEILLLSPAPFSPIR